MSKKPLFFEPSSLYLISSQVVPSHVFEYLLKLGLSPYDTDRDGCRAIDFVDTAYKAKYEDLLKALYFF